MQVLVPMAVTVLVAGGSLIGWVTLFRHAAKTEGKESPGPDPSHSGSH
jgi:predicted membrane protein